MGITGQDSGQLSYGTCLNHTIQSFTLRDGGSCIVKNASSVFWKLQITDAVHMQRSSYHKIYLHID